MNEPNTVKRKVCPYCLKTHIKFLPTQKSWKCYACKQLFEKYSNRNVEIRTPKRKPQNIDIPTPQEVLHTINNAPAPWSARTRALMALLYLTGARVSEIVKRVKKLDFEPIKHNGHDMILLHNVICLKTKKDYKRNIPIAIYKEPEFWSFVQEYLDELEDNAVLFPFNRHRAYDLVKYSGWFPHFFRHMRSTLLTTKYNFGYGELKKYHGWLSGTSAEYYVRLNWQNVADLLSK